VEIGGRAGWRATSVHSRLTIPAHTVAGERGTLTLWVLSMEHLAPVPPMPHLLELEPDWRIHTLLSDHPDLRAREKARFHLRYTTDWWRNLSAQFHSQQATGYNAIIAPDHFQFRPRRWYQLAVTWDKPAGQYRLYANGVLVAAENIFLHMPHETAGPELFAGNPLFALGELCFYQQVLEAAEIGRAYEESGRVDQQLVEELQQQHAGKNPDRFAWEPIADPTWKQELDCPFTRPDDLKGWWIQGQADSTSITPEGLLVNTAPGDSRQHGLKQNKVEMYLWSEQLFRGDLALQVDFQLLAPNGLALIMVHSSGMQREDFMSDYPRRADGSMKMVCWENVRSYHWEFYRETDNTRNDVATHLLVKNPWMYGLAYQAMPQRLEPGAWHRLQYVQEAGRIRGSIDGVRIFDVEDAPHNYTGPVYDFGRIALRCKFKTKMLYRDLKVWTRP
jgi:hypothetical protein